MKKASQNHNNLCSLVTKSSTNTQEHNQPNEENYSLENINNDLKEPLNIKNKTLNKNYSAFKFYFYMILYCIPGFYYGAESSIMTNLGKPIIRKSFGITDTEKMALVLGTINLSFGLGKLPGSIVGGSIAKQIGKHNVLYIGLIGNIMSCI